MLKLIITEKPSVAKNIADALKIKHKSDGYFEGNGYIITWAFGHLLELYDAKDYDEKMARWSLANFPFIPSNFRYKVKSDPRNRGKEDLGAKKQLKIIYSLMKRNDVEMIISACDFDREGQIIGDTIIYNFKTQKKVYRLLQNEWTPDEVLKGLQNIKPNIEMKPLQDAGIGRQWADWVIGINLTSVATLQYQKGSRKVLNIGRVLMPTLKVIYDRDKEIENFVPKKFYKLEATFKTRDEKEYKGTYLENEIEKFESKEVLELIKQALANQMASIDDKQVEKKREYPPYLFNLSNLQGYITSKYKGWTSEKVLKIAQSLYEKKYITYPRTASVVLEESLVGKSAKVLDTLKIGLPYENEIKFAKLKRVFDNSKVESHSAIIPTYLIPKSLTIDEQMVYTAIKNRFIMQFMPVAEHEETKIITKVNNSEIKGRFISKGRVQLVEGWKKVEKIESKDTILPLVKINDSVSIENNKLSSHTTKPPKYHTEKTLLRVMETCGKGYEDDDSEEMMAAILSGYSIGTPATRAGTIKKLKDVGYIVGQNKNLTCTELGKKIVTAFPIKELFDLEFTGRLEKTLSDIEKQKFTKEAFLELIYEFTTTAVKKIKSEQKVIINEVQSTKGQQIEKEYEVLGKCPLCGQGIIEGTKGYGCSNWRNGCKFVIWKNDEFLASVKKKLTKTMVKMFLKNGEVTVKGLTSKDGNKFDAVMSYEKNEENEIFSWKMKLDN
ncbi:type IA DNA topoisomerase [Desulfonispora thiosulfatigenes]|uniref:type IA DNA topoisomerase n=1 Tax=Desulfonispora thiosulfatigenes TaxID=83661 RepID=UPI0009FFB6AA|nr:type IA DNA topoisomerase [Desulfonispora thiosulfatigenes]